jgi:hypothetical protein
MGGLALDFTLVVQAINFGIAYIVIRTLLLKPVYAMIQKNLAHERSLNHKIETTTLANNAQQEHMHAQWQLFRAMVKEKVPSTMALEPIAPVTCVSKKVAIHPVDHEYVNYLVTSIAKDIVERIDHVRS